MSNQEATAGTAESTTQTRIPGTFCWWEAGTTDQNAAKKFYSDLIGWTINDVPIGPDMIYTMFQVDGKDVTALYQMDQEMISRGIPPHWMSYVLVENADDAAAKATAAGGTVMQAPFDVMEHGRMAVIKDPTGAVFAVWQAGQHKGSGQPSGLGTVCWNELMTNDTAAAGTFYSTVFGWERQEMPMGPMIYTMFKIGETNVGGMMAIDPQWGPVPPHWMLYITVANCDATVAKATELGGSVLQPPFDVEGVGRMALLKDPQGAAFSVLTFA